MSLDVILHSLSPSFPSPTCLAACLHPTCRAKAYPFLPNPRQCHAHHGNHSPCRSWCRPAPGIMSSSLMNHPVLPGCHPRDSRQSSRPSLASLKTRRAYCCGRPCTMGAIAHCFGCIVLCRPDVPAYLHNVLAHCKCALLHISLPYHFPFRRHWSSSKVNRFQGSTTSVQGCSQSFV